MSRQLPFEQRCRQVALARFDADDAALVPHRSAEDDYSLLSAAAGRRTACGAIEPKTD